MKSRHFLLIFLLPVSLWTGYLLGGFGYLLTPLMVFGLIPILDAVLGTDERNPSGEEEKTLAEDRSFRYITWACAPVQAIMVLWGAWAVTHEPLTWLEMAGLALSVGINSGVMGINVSHELVHRINNRLEPFLGKAMLLTVAYMHWSLEHVKGHHRNVATPLDPATARLGESVYSFWPRTVGGGFRSAWVIEAATLARRGLSVYSIRNPLLRYLVLEAVFALLLAIGFGWGAVVFFVAQSFVALSLLEVVNYLEHYGLERRRLPDGRYEKVTPLHSWNASHRLTNIFLFNLQRHSDHHARPAGRYQTLRHFEESPQLPNGYAGMVLLALVPPLWRKVMDDRVLAFRARHAGSRPV